MKRKAKVEGRGVHKGEMCHVLYLIRCLLSQMCKSNVWKGKKYFRRECYISRDEKGTVKYSCMMQNKLLPVFCYKRRAFTDLSSIPVKPQHTVGNTTQIPEQGETQTEEAAKLNCHQYSWITSFSLEFLWYPILYRLNLECCQEQS